jgi:hypothetical protein
MSRRGVSCRVPDTGVVSNAYTAEDVASLEMEAAILRSVLQKTIAIVTVQIEASGSSLLE